MSEALIQLIFSAVAAAFLVIVTEVVVGHFRPTVRRGLPSTLVGLGLLAAGGVLTVAGPRNLPFSWLENPLTRVFIRETVCLFGGALFLVCGVIWQIAGGAGRRHMLRLGQELRQTNFDLASAQEVLASVVRSSVSGVMMLDAIRDHAGVVVDFVCQFINEEAEQLLGRRASDLLGKPLLEQVPCLKEQGLLYEAVTVLDSRRTFRDERSCQHDGREMWYQIAVVKHGDGVIATFTDVSRRKRTEKKLQHAAKYDGLTDLASRSLLVDRLTQAITRRRRLPEYKFAVLFLDFDRFKIVNDSLGHKVGDQLLISVADRLRANLREIDTPALIGGEHVPARLGGDEFVVLLDGIPDARAALVVAERLQDMLAEPHILEGHEVISTASIGIVVIDGNYEQPEDILRDADTAMYQAKSAGKARSVIFDEKMHREVLERLTLEKELRQATEEEAFKLNYQPIVNLETAALRGFEALIRWPHPKRGIVPPDQFITLAEELGLIVPIGGWVMREAARQLRCWQERRPGYPLSMTVNLSKKQLSDPDLTASVAELIEQIEIEPKYLVLEITESTIMDNIDELTPVLAGLHEVGVRLAMDDFGTGHSSLSFLHRVPMDFLKIDRSFINRTGEGRKYEAIIETIVRLAHNLDMEVVAEGVETEDQTALLQSLKCNYGQGYLFSKPLEAQDAEKLVGSDYRFAVAA
ncbi:MAG: putative bifunctional diguanylate cyclase/phosphodiesterase [Planctomycetota bacterium]|jgi:diguanylate cyclase (GGDEF)-like protein/PAS domain S-box-containing protein